MGTKIQDTGNAPQICAHEFVAYDDSHLFLVKIFWFFGSLFRVSDSKILTQLNANVAYSNVYNIQKLIPIRNWSDGSNSSKKSVMVMAFRPTAFKLVLRPPIKMQEISNAYIFRR